MILFSHVIIPLIFGDAFSPAREPLLILLVATFVSVIMVPLNSLQGATGRAGPATAAALATIVVQIVLMLVLIPSLGIAGAAWARVGGLLASAAIMLPTAFMRLRQSPTIASEAQAI
jgi:O-antigen/teichoic acid export membrane protein